MSIRIKQEKADVICKMDEHLRDMFQDDSAKLWENTYIKHQIDKRNNGGSFSISDHIRAMVYSMLSSGSTWDRLAKEADPVTGHILPIDRIFHNYDPAKLLSCSSEQLQNELKEIHLAPRFIARQMDALLSVNITKLLKFEKEYGTVDNYYQKYIQRDKGMIAPISIVKALSDSKSKDKMAQMEVPLVCEYLRNVGYDFPKPDTHICRILGSEILAFSTSREVPPYQAIQIIFKLTKMINKSVAETDYILWSYCSTGYGEICTSKSPRCDLCVAIKHCKKHVGDIENTVKNQYVLKSHYGIRETDSISEIIQNAAKVSYMDFHRRVVFGKSVPVECRAEITEEIEILLTGRIPNLLESADQKTFDKKHHAICEEITNVYGRVCRQNYGIAQRWLNQTLMNLIIIESALVTSKLPVMRIRKYFHVPVEKGILKIATTRKKDRFYHGLGLSCAPVRHDNTDTYDMDWYSPERTQPIEKWEYAEYMEFQKAVRNALKDAIRDGVYKDVADWGFHALKESEGIIW